MCGQLDSFLLFILWFQIFLIPSGALGKVSQPEAVSVAVVVRAIMCAIVLFYNVMGIIATPSA